MADIVELIINLRNAGESLKTLGDLQKAKDSLNKGEISLRFNTNELRKQATDIQKTIDRLTKQRNDVAFGVSGVKDAEAALTRIRNLIRENQLLAQRQRDMGIDDAHTRAVINSLRDQETYWRKIQEAVKHGASGIREYDQAIARSKEQLTDVRRQIEEGGNRLRDYSIAQKEVNAAVKEEAALRKEASAAVKSLESARQKEYQQAITQAKKVAEARQQTQQQMFASAQNVKELRAEQLKQDLDEALRILQEINAETTRLHQQWIQQAGAPGRAVQAMGQGIASLGSTIKSMSGIFTNNSIVDTLQRYMTVMGSRMFTQNWGKAFERYDILSTYSDYLGMVGVSAEEAEASLAKLNAGIQGIPVGLSDVAYQTRMYQMYVDDLERATNLAIGLERALVAGGANEQMRNTARYEIDRLLSAGELSTSRQYRALMQGLGVSSRYLREEMGYGDLSNAQFVSALFKKEISGEELIRGLEKLASSPRLNAAIETFRTTIESGLSNINFALTRGKANILDALNESLEVGTGKNISGWLYQIRDMINEVYRSMANWVRMNPDRIAGIIDTIIHALQRLGDVDWARIIEGIIRGFERLIDIIVFVSEKMPDGFLEDFIVFSTVWAKPVGDSLIALGLALSRFGQIWASVLTTIEKYKLGELIINGTTIKTLGDLKALLPVLGKVGLVLGGIALAAMTVDEALNGASNAFRRAGLDIRDFERSIEQAQAHVNDAMSFEVGNIDDFETKMTRAKELLNDIRSGTNLRASVAELNRLFPDLAVSIDSATGKLTKHSQETLKSADAQLEYARAIRISEQADADAEKLRALRAENQAKREEIEEKLAKAREAREKSVRRRERGARDTLVFDREIAELEAELAELQNASAKIDHDTRVVGKNYSLAQAILRKVADQFPNVFGNSIQELVDGIDKAQEDLDELREKNKELQENYRKTLDELFSGFGKYEPPKPTNVGALETNLSTQIEALDKFIKSQEALREYLLKNDLPGLTEYVDQATQKGDEATINALAEALAQGRIDQLERIDKKASELIAKKRKESARETLLPALLDGGIESIAEQIANGDLTYGGDLEGLIIEALAERMANIDRQKIVEEIQKGSKGETSFLDLDSFLGFKEGDAASTDEAERTAKAAYEKVKTALEDYINQAGPVIDSIIGIDTANFEKQKQEMVSKALELLGAVQGAVAEMQTSMSGEDGEIDPSTLVGGFQMIPATIATIVDESLPTLVTAMDDTAMSCVDAINRIIRAVNELIAVIQRLISVLEQLRQKFTQVEYTAVQAFNRIKQSVQEAINKVQELINKLQELKGFDGLTIDVNLNGGLPAGAPEGAGNPDSSAYWSTRAHTGGLIGEKGGVSYFAEGGFAKGTDTVPAMLTPGEYVMRREAVNRLGVPFLQRLNRMDIGAAFDSIMSRVYRPMVSPSTAYNYYTTSNDNRKYSNTQHIHTNNPDFAFRIANRYAHAF